MFRGVSELNLDGKGRLAIPTRWRDLLLTCCEGNLIITVDVVERCLAIYPLSEWEPIQQKLDRLSTMDSRSAMIKRLVLGNATDVAMDSHGRVLLPKKLRSHALLEKELVLIGQGRKFELWDSAMWDERCQTWQQTIQLGYAEIPLELQELGI
ncbi:transcriptional regulator MraZ [Ectothiorhodospiraceae bacterium BW-2]|nr:transcriptional regulator MraZ [Ectothiorhodospiraceae bacterium BW-2]